MSTLAFDKEKFRSLLRRAVAEGVTLLKNDGDVLPLAEGTKIALFGRSQFNYYKSGTGSGGMVNVKEVVGVYEAFASDPRFTLDADLRKTYEEWVADHPFDNGVGWASEPWFQAEMPITADLAKKCAKKSDVAIILIGRTAGEDQDNRNERGSYLLTEEEEKMLEAVTGAFKKTVVLLNVGNIIDMNWVAKYDPSAVAYIWQGGQEGGYGALAVVAGDVNPCGRLTDTIAYDIADYPSTANFGGKERNFQQEDIYVGYRYFETFAKDRVLYPFGYGISYTEFSIAENSFHEEKSGVKAVVSVKNVGERAGRQVVQFYVSKPQGMLGQPAIELVDFVKTPLLAPGESCNVELRADEDRLVSYDDSGVTGHKSAYVMEQGTYYFYAGFDVRSNLEVGSISVAETNVIKQMSEAMAPVEPFERMKPEFVDGAYRVTYESVPLATVTREQHREWDLPTEWKGSDMGWKLVDVYDHKCSMEQFIAQLSDQDLICIVRGEGMSSPKVTPGCGGAFGGVTDSLLEKGIPVACCSDGPSGIRMDSGRIAFSMPNGACLAASWDLALVEDLYEMEGLELRKNKIDVLLGPGMNLHRNPLNGRNFEYFSEDPLVTGRNAAAQLRGMHRNNVTGTIKHFAMNTQESGRYSVEHIASERAIRQIYLKGFEIAVKEGRAKAVMTTYGTVNGYYTSSDYDLVTRILRS
jgi:beta-glucosidase